MIKVFKYWILCFSVYINVLYAPYNILSGIISKITKYFSLHRWMKYKCKEPYWINKKPKIIFKPYDKLHFFAHFMYFFIHLCLSPWGRIRFQNVLNPYFRNSIMFVYLNSLWLMPHVNAYNKRRDFQLLFFDLDSCHLNHLNGTHKFKMKWLLLLIRNVLEGKSNVLCFR